MDCLEKYNDRNGFSLLEIVMTVAMLSILGALTLPAFIDAQVRNELSIAAETTAQSVRRAQTLSRASVGDSSWGVDVRNGGTVTIFQGSYGSAYDEVFEFPSTISVASSPASVSFDKLTGDRASGSDTSITLTGPEGSTRTITINSHGVVEW